ncbi:STAS domain-containing protein [Kineosporia babensis]|uniref:STAS domain-containing protein n=1 Tax=Kineosporia babensis TaxID=499548 RepID=A0A9X1NA49_9ACTN|nr:STAS domain-containing protein [Kineosporia babensis]MCD5310036.1 STAS domain-containing protein [Kineosporia babensis]
MTGSPGPRLTVDVVNPGMRLRLKGRLDARSAPAARSGLHAAVDGGQGELVIEMNQLEIWDGAGLGVLVGTARRVRQGERQLVLTGVRARELRLLRVARVTWSSSVRAAALAG